MLEIRKLGLEDTASYAKLYRNAYPGFGGTQEQAVATMNRMFSFPERAFYGVYRDDVMVGGMCLLEFEMNLRGQGMVPVGGVALVAVDLLYKKEKIAKEIMSFSLHHFRDKGIGFVTLFPFRMSFYKQMGFGSGVEHRRYSMEAASIPNFGSKANLEILSADNLEEVIASYNRYALTRNGLTPLAKHHLEGFFKADTARVIGFRKYGELKGYMLMRFIKDHMLVNQLYIPHIVYETGEALQEMLTFLHTQGDQFHKVNIATQDESIHYMLSTTSTNMHDVFDSIFLETSVTGCGLMVRVIDVPKLFSDLQHHNFNGETLKLKLTLEDSFLPQNTASAVIDFREGRPHVLTDADGTADVELTLEVSNFSSLLAGTTTFDRLHRLGVAKLSDDAHVETLTRLFRTSERMMCMFAF
ncbi:GNAT family N-acetyltransferase [Tumebacillus avium]|nr:GNAT family N-acetyltransferase [Tumebacillus avium]